MVSCLLFSIVVVVVLCGKVPIPYHYYVHVSHNKVFCGWMHEDHEVQILFKTCFVGGWMKSMKIKYCLKTGHQKLQIIKIQVQIIEIVTFTTEAL